MTRPLMLLDTAGLWFRAFHSVPEKITGPTGAPANAVRGFCAMTAALVREYDPGRLIAAWDADWRPQWRVDLLPTYKTHRVAEDGTEDAPDTLDPQIDQITAVLDGLGICRAEAAEMEADDILAQLAAAHEQVLVVTGDRDLFQLASPSTSVVYIGAGMKKQQAYSPAMVAEKFGLPIGPDHADARLYADYAVLVGDASDGLPGVAGIGAKSAATLLATYGDLDGLLAAARDEESTLTARQRSALLDGADYVVAARDVVRLGGREIDIEFHGDPSGRIGAGDSATLDTVREETGQSNAIDRLATAVEGLDRV